MLDNQKFENKNKLTNIDFGSASPTEMAASIPEPRTFKEKRQYIQTKPNNIDFDQARANEMIMYEHAAE